MMDNPKFNHAVMATLKPYLEALLGSKEVTEDERAKYGDYATLIDDDAANIDAVTDA